MHNSLLDIIRCPVTRTILTLQPFKKSIKQFNGVETEIIEEGILYAEKHFFYPVIKGIPRLIVEAVIDFEDFLKLHMPDFELKRNELFKQWGDVINKAHNKNKRTKESFSFEWKFYNYKNDKTWEADDAKMLERFLAETDETPQSIIGKKILDAGCGNGKLNVLLGENNIFNVAIDFSPAIEKAYQLNSSNLVHFIQADIQFLPVAFNYFDIVHCSGVLIHTNNTELSFSCIEPAVKQGGKLSIWIYHKRNDFIHKTVNVIRRFTSKLPIKIQYYLYAITIFPVSYVIKKLKGNPQNKNEMMIAIFDWFSPQYRWEHSKEEAFAWFSKHNYTNIKATTTELWGFDMVGEKK